MPRVQRVAKCRVDQAPCGKCEKLLPAGSAYIYWEFRFGGKHTRCTATACYPRPSELTQSEIKGNAYTIQETATTVAEASTLDELESLRDEAAQGVEEIVELIQEKLDAIEEGMGHTEVPVYEELEERREGYEGWQQEIEGADFEDFGETEMEDKSPEERDACKEEWFEEQREVLQEALNNCPE